jgi:cytosine/adenosine deaminase-related metal-dependent hydrolase
MHLAESAAEMELLESGSGPFRSFLQELGLWDGKVFPGGRSVEPFVAAMAKAERGLIVHGNYLDAGSQKLLTEHRNLFLVYCPRTHNHFGHARNPWRAIQQSGGRVILGTDGRVSNQPGWHSLSTGCVAEQQEAAAERGQAEPRCWSTGVLDKLLVPGGTLPLDVEVPPEASNQCEVECEIDRVGGTAGTGCVARQQEAAA